MEEVTAKANKDITSELDALQRHLIMHSIISFIPIFRTLAYVQTPPPNIPTSQKWRFTGRVWRLDLGQNRHQAPPTVHFRKAAVLYNHWVKCSFGAVIDCYCSRRVTAQKWKQTQSSASVMSALALYFFSLKKFIFACILVCGGIFELQKKSCVPAEGGLAFIFANQ